MKATSFNCFNFDTYLCLLNLTNSTQLKAGQIAEFESAQVYRSLGWRPSKWIDLATWCFVFESRGWYEKTWCFLSETLEVCVRIFLALQICSLICSSVSASASSSSSLIIVCFHFSKQLAKLRLDLEARLFVWTIQFGHPLLAKLVCHQVHWISLWFFVRANLCSSWALVFGGFVRPTSKCRYGFSLLRLDRVVRLTLFGLASIKFGPSWATQTRWNIAPTNRMGCNCLLQKFFASFQSRIQLA